MAKKNKNFKVIKKGEPHQLSGSSPDPFRTHPGQASNRGFDALVDEMVGASSQPNPSRPAEALASQHHSVVLPTHQLSSKPVRQPGLTSRQSNKQAPTVALLDPPPGVPSNLSYPLYFYLHSPSSRPLTDTSQLILSESLEAALQTPEPNATYMRNGSILVRAASRTQSQVLSSLSHLGKIPVISKPDDVRNTSKGTIYAPGFCSDSPGDILAHLQRRNVPITNVYRFPPRKDRPMTTNARLLLTFSVPFPPTEVKLGFTVHTVRTYVSFPRRCFKCHRFGHPQKYCRSSQTICPTCGSSLHPNCNKDPPCCPNCKGPHPASSVHCPFFTLEKEIQEQCAIHKYDRREATRRAKEKLAHLPLSYARAAATTSVVPRSSQRSRALRSDPPISRSSVQPSISKPGSSGGVISVAQDNCSPISSTMIRPSIRLSSPPSTTLSHDIHLAEIHNPPEGLSPANATRSTSTVDDRCSPAPSESHFTISRKRPASVSPKTHLGTLAGPVNPPKGGSSPTRHPYSLAYRTTDFLKQEKPVCAVGSSSLLKRARRSGRPRDRVGKSDSHSASSALISQKLPKTTSRDQYSSDSDTFSDAAMDSSDTSLSVGVLSVVSEAPFRETPRVVLDDTFRVPRNVSRAPNPTPPPLPSSPVLGIGPVVDVPSSPSQSTVPFGRCPPVGGTARDVDDDLARLFGESSPKVAKDPSCPNRKGPHISLLRDLPLPPGFSIPVSESVSDSLLQTSSATSATSHPIVTIVTDRSAH